MAFPAWAGAAMQAGSGIIGNVLGYAANDKLSHDNRTFAHTMMNKEFEMNREAWNMQNMRDDEVWNRQNAKNLEFWNMQNYYDSPAQQMQRFKEAGLNPALIYGQQSQSGSIQTANPAQSQMKGAAGRQANQTAFIPNLQFLNDGLMSILNIREKAAQIDNVKEQNNVLKEEAALKEAQTLGTLAGRDVALSQSDRLNYDLSLDNELRNVSIDARREQLRKLKIESDLALRADARAQEAQPLTMSELRAKIKQLGVDTDNKEMDTQLKKLEYKFKSLPYGTDLLNRMGGKLLWDLSKDLVPDWDQSHYLNK